MRIVLPGRRLGGTCVDIDKIGGLNLFLSIFVVVVKSNFRIWSFVNWLESSQSTQNKKKIRLSPFSARIAEFTANRHCAASAQCNTYSSDVFPHITSTAPTTWCCDRVISVTFREDFSASTWTNSVAYSPAASGDAEIRGILVSTGSFAICWR